MRKCFCCWMGRSRVDRPPVGARHACLHR